MAKRIIGLETEYGCLVDANENPYEVIAGIRDWLFEKGRYGLIDQHHRGWDEPAGNGGFLFNGGRMYIDMGHMEYCSPECLSLRDAVRYDRAGDLLLVEAVRDLGLGEQAQFFRNNLDHYTGATFGCHENYSMARSAPLTEKNVFSLLAFQTLRTLFTGAGRVGRVTPSLFAERFADWRELGESVDDPPFQISQRADFIENDFYQWVQGSRAIVNTRDEPLCDPSRFRRLHVLHGDTNVLPAALFLKLGATSLVLDLLEEDALPEVTLADAVLVLRSLSRSVEPPWRVRLANGREKDALELLERYRFQAERRFGGRDEETDALLALWKRVLEGLASDPASLVGVLDWVTKRSLLGSFMQSEGLDWEHRWVKAQDLEYHHIDPERSLGLALADESGAWSPERLKAALIEPPSDTRARARSDSMRKIATSKDEDYVLDWDRVEALNGSGYFFPDPYDTRPAPLRPDPHRLRSRRIPRR